MKIMMIVMVTVMNVFAEQVCDSSDDDGNGNCNDYIDHENE